MICTCWPEINVNTVLVENIVTYVLKFTKLVVIKLEVRGQLFVVT